MNLKFVISYDGTHYLGWQKTKMGPSIEEELEKALGQILQEEIVLQAASRTDAGVHAEGQVVNFKTARTDLNLRKLKTGLNGLLPKDISITSIEDALESFHPSVNAKGKEYHYNICLGTVQLPFNRKVSWHFPYPLELELMKKGAAIITGTHDFSAFCNQRSLLKKDAVRTVHSIELATHDNERMLVKIRGEHFLYKMVRNLVGTLVYIGCGKLHVEVLGELLTNKDRKRAGVTAPAHGLLLKEVFF